MSLRNDVSPSTLSVSVEAEGVHVEYLDGREVVYRGEPEAMSGEVRCRPGKDVHVLVTDAAAESGVMVYVNDRKTHDDILASTGVGRVMLEAGEHAELFPGVTAGVDGYAVVVRADPEVAGGRVFVFEEDELGERSYEIVQ